MRARWSATNPEGIADIIEEMSILALLTMLLLVLVAAHWVTPRRLVGRRSTVILARCGFARRAKPRHTLYPAIVGTLACRVDRPPR